MKLKLPPGTFKAYLFDCDGTIADSMPLHYVAWSKALSEWNCEFSEDTFYAWGGMPVAEIISTLNANHGLNMPVEDVAKRKEQLYYEILPQLQGRPRSAGAHRSQSWPDSLRRRFRKHPRFSDRIAGGAQDPRPLRHPRLRRRLRRSKPDPEPFLIAAERLGKTPADCLVFEDTEMGIQAATAAGMASVRVPAALGKKEQDHLTRMPDLRKTT